MDVCVEIDVGWREIRRKDIQSRGSVSKQQRRLRGPLRLTCSDLKISHVRIAVAAPMTYECHRRHRGEEGSRSGVLVPTFVVLHQLQSVLLVRLLQRLLFRALELGRTEQEVSVLYNATKRKNKEKSRKVDYV
jgi:hypothetical protein